MGKEKSKRRSSTPKKRRSRPNIIVEDKKKRASSSRSGSEDERQRSRSRSRSRSKENNKYIPTNEPQLKYVVLKQLQDDKFLYPVPTYDFFEDIRNHYRHIKGAYSYLGKLNCEKVLDDITRTSGILIEEHSKGIYKVKFIMSVNKDKIEQLCRESYRDRPKNEVDLECMGNDINTEDRERKLREDKQREKEELIKRCRPF